jgi:hypothetical protein
LPEGGGAVVGVQRRGKGREGKGGTQLGYVLGALKVSGGKKCWRKGRWAEAREVLILYFETHVSIGLLR